MNTNETVEVRNSEHGGKKRWLVVIGLFFGLLFTEMDETVINTALPTIVRELGGLSLYGWVSAIYLLALTLSLPIMGKLADVYGRKRIYLCSLGLFVAGSLFSGFAHSMTELIVFRGIQGIGGGGLIPLASVIVADLFPIELRAKIQGFFGSLFVVVTAAGPAVGGLLTEHIDWRWIFYMNIPFGLTAAVLIATGLKESKGDRSAREGIDWAGALLIVAGLVPLLLATVLTGPGFGYTWRSPLIVGMLIWGFLALCLFIRVEYKAANPVLPLYLFRNRTVAIVSALAFCVSFGTFGILTYMPFYAQNSLGFSPTAAGYLAAPMAVGVIASGMAFAYLVTKVRYRTLFAASLVVAVAGSCLLASMDLNIHVILPFVYVLIAGLGIGMVMMGKETVVQEMADKKDVGAVTTAVSLVSQLGAAVGVSLLGGVLSSSVANRVAEIGSNLPPDESRRLERMIEGGVPDGLSGPLLRQAQEMYQYGIHHIYMVISVVLGAAFIFSLFLGKGKLGSDRSGNEE